MSTTLASVIDELGPRAVPCDLYDDLGGPLYHDITLGDDTELREVLAILRQSAPEASVLELAAGAGRMALPLAAQGHRVVALDNSAHLLALLEQRRDDLVGPARARLTTTRQDMAGFTVAEAVDLVLLGSTSITLLTPEGRQHMYDAVERHTVRAGLFLVTVPQPTAPDGLSEEVHRVVTGHSGEQYDMFDSWHSGDPHRTVTVIPRSRSTAQVPVATSRPLLFDGAAVGGELAARGHRLRTEVRVGGCTERLDISLQLWEVAA